MTFQHDDLIKKSDPSSINRARSLFSNDKIKSLTKVKIQEYIESFFIKNSENNDLLSIVSPRSINYNIDKSFDPRLDPTQRKLQIARYFTELKGKIPCILIVDGGIIPVAHNIGQISDAYLKDNFWHGHYPILRKIPLNIVFATRDQESADEMSSVASLLFNELRNLAGGSYIHGKQEEGDTWVISLPNAPVETSGVDNVDVEGDPVERIFYAESTLEILYEDSVRIKSQLPEIKQGNAYINEPNLLQNSLPIIECPDNISINSQVSVIVRNIQDKYKIAIQDSTIATMTYQMVLTPRKYGTTKILVIDPSRTDNRIIAEKTINII